jgi:hypothetical protein
VAQDDRNASIEVWRALSVGCPVFHPKGMAYGEQAFWSGVAYSGPDTNPWDSGAQPPVGLPDAMTAKKTLLKLLALST